MPHERNGVALVVKAKRQLPAGNNLAASIHDCFLNFDHLLSSATRIARVTATFNRSEDIARVANVNVPGGTCLKSGRMNKLLFLQAV
jgi:hypothetical protein